MNNNTIQNNGNQYFQENNFYDSNYVHYKTEDCIALFKRLENFLGLLLQQFLG